MKITVHPTITAFQAVHDTQACFDDKPDAELPSGENALVQKEYNPFGEDIFHIFLPDGRVVSCTGERPTIDELAQAIGSGGKSKLFKTAPVATPKVEDKAPPAPPRPVGGFKLPAKPLRPVNTPLPPVEVPAPEPAPPAPEPVVPTPPTPTPVVPVSRPSAPVPTPAEPVVAPSAPKDEPASVPPLVPNKTTLPVSEQSGDLSVLLKNLAIAARWHQVHADWYRSLVGTSEDAQRFSAEARTHDKLAKAIEEGRDLLSGKRRA